MNSSDTCPDYTQLRGNSYNPCADKLFAQLELPIHSAVQQDPLEQLISAEKVICAIKSTRPNKPPGHNGLSMAYYTTFTELLVPLLTNTLNSLLEHQSFWTETLIAIVTMLPKPCSNVTTWLNYRPISLPNLDIRILAKVLTSHLLAMGDFSI